MVRSGALHSEEPSITLIFPPQSGVTLTGLMVLSTQEVVMGNRVYEGRFKGSTDTHLPNKESKEGHEGTKWDSHERVVCPECDRVSYVHKLELKIWSCGCGLP